MKPLILLGHEALSGFRLKALLQGIQKADPSLKVTSIDARYVYLLEAQEELSGEMFRMAADLLGTGERFDLAGGFFVTPRKGTISPWSSKATDIFRNCGLEQILRVERGIHYRVHVDGRERQLAELGRIVPLLHDRMTEGVYEQVNDLFRHIPPAPMRQVDVIAGGKAALEKINIEWGLALSGEEIEYLYEAYKKIGRNPTDVELVMFGQANSEHCRHKIFNATWVVDGKKQDKSLFDMIRNTHAKTPGGTLSAYRDNSAVMEGFKDGWFLRKGDGSGDYGYIEDQIDILIKVETHNHPTAICPFPGAATGVGGEIRDEAATGTSGKTKAGLSAFMVSHLRIPGYAMPWEKDYAEFPSRLATPLQIMLEGPIGGAAFGNEFGRPQLCGMFRTLEHLHGSRYRGYHKPVMVAGGMGNLRRKHVAKKDISEGALIMQIGGPAMKIGLGGGAASSMATGSNAEALDFDSVQRGNAEMQRRCQEVIDVCIAMGDRNPILSVHDIGAGGLSNGCPELVSETGGAFELRKIPCVDSSMSPMEIWCCEAQERYVLAIAPESLELFRGLCERERCPMAVLGRATGNMHLGLKDDHFNNKPIDLDIRVILGKPPKMVRTVNRLAAERKSLDLSGITVSEAIERILRFPAVAAKNFLITIADRSVTGLVARDQMAGPYQVPISDCAVTTTTLKAYTGEAMAMGERTSLAEESGPASGRMAIGEALTNMVGIDIGDIGKIKLSANWMCACGEPGEDAGLFDTVQAVGMELCPKLGIAIPVGKDSLSMRTVWRDSRGKDWRMTAPLTLVITGFAPVRDVRRTVTADLKADPSVLFLADLGAGRNRLGCSTLAQVYDRAGGEVPDLDDADMVVRYWKAVQEMVGAGLLLAYHDRSDGGLFSALAEMSFGGRRGLTVDLKDKDILPALFAEELGGVFQVREQDAGKVSEIAERHGIARIWVQIGAPDVSRGGDLCIKQSGKEVYRKPVCQLHSAWSELTARMQGMRDNPECARQEWEATRAADDPGMQFKLSYDPAGKPRAFTRKPRMAILREQGVNGHVEMAGAFDRAGFQSVDVHMTDLLGGKVNLDDFAGLVACGGFSYGDVLGAGSGWAKSVLFNPRIKEMFARFFARPDSFALGVCNGCQMVSQLKSIIPGAEMWPEFTRNKSEQFEARYATVEIMQSPSILLRGMEGSILPIPVAHGEGYADFSRTGSSEGLKKQKLQSVRFVDNRGKATEMYPFNPNGSAGGLTGVTTVDGRVTILMPHPERGFRSVQMSYRPRDMFCSEEGPWFRIFQNAREFAG